MKGSLTEDMISHRENLKNANKNCRTDKLVSWGYNIQDSYMKFSWRDGFWEDAGLWSKIKFIKQ